MSERVRSEFGHVVRQGGAAEHRLACGCTLTPGSVAVLACHKHAKAALVRPGALSAQILDDLYGPVFGRRSVGSLDGDEHVLLRSVLQPLFGPDLNNTAFGGCVESAVDRCLSALGGHGRMDLLSSVIAKVPGEIVLAALGQRPGQGKVLSEWTRCILGFHEQPKEALGASRSLKSFLEEVVAESGARRGQNLLSELVAQLGTERSVVHFLRFLVPAAVGTVIAGMTNVMYGALRAYPDMQSATSGPAGVHGLVREGLRWAPPASWIARRTRNPQQVGGVEVESGEPVLISVGDANHDGSRYQDAGDFVADRQAGVGLAFGLGAHQCLGRVVALAEITSLVERATERLPNLRLAGPDPVRRDTGPVSYAVNELRVAWG